LIQGARALANTRTFLKLKRATKASSPPAPDYSALLNDKRFIKAVAERVKALSPSTRKRKRSTKAKAA